LFFFAFIVLIGIVTRPIIFPRDSKKSDTPSVIETIPSASEQHPSSQSPIMTEIRQKIERMQEKTKVSAGLMISDDHLPQKRYYAIQVGAFRNLNYTHDCVERVKKIDPHVYYITTDSKTKGILYKVFVGDFLDRDEAINFIKEKKIFNDFPDNFIQEFLLSEAKQ
jgi:cell division septation protein DedD